MPRVKRNIQDGYNTSFAKRLRELIESKGITQNQLAGVIGKTRQAVNNYTLGNTAPDSDTLIKLSEYFNVSVDYLLGLSDVQTTDKDIKYICEYTGLNARAVDRLHNCVGVFSNFINFCLNEYENEIALANLITSFVMYKVDFDKKVDFVKKLVNSKKHNDIGIEIVQKCIDKDIYLSDKINVTEFKIHKQIVELLNLYAKAQRQEYERYSNDYDYILFYLHNKGIEKMENDLLQGSEHSGND